MCRLFTGRLSDRTGRHWALSITGYAITMISVPLLALAGPLWLACAFVIGERFGKAVRSPARDTMLAAASAKLGAGRTFALHEALDQSGALVGPLVVAAMLATHPRLQSRIRHPRRPRSPGDAGAVLPAPAGPDARRL